jgi:hypothetical protein
MKERTVPEGPVMKIMQPAPIMHAKIPWRILISNGGPAEEVLKKIEKNVNFERY